MQPEVCSELLIWGHALDLKVAIETSGCRPIPDGFDMVLLTIKTSLESWLYNSYTQDTKAFDNVVQNLERLDPRVTEIRYVIHETDQFSLDPFSDVAEMLVNGFSSVTATVLFMDVVTPEAGDMDIPPRTTVSGFWIAMVGVETAF